MCSFKAWHIWYLFTRHDPVFYIPKPGYYSLFVYTKAQFSGFDSENSYFINSWPNNMCNNKLPVFYSTVPLHPKNLLSGCSKYYPSKNADFNKGYLYVKFLYEANSLYLQIIITVCMSCFMTYRYESCTGCVPWHHYSNVKA